MKSIREWLILVKITQVYQPIIIKVAPSIGSIECIQLFSSWCKSEVKQEKREENHVAWIKKAFSCSPQNWHLRQFLWRRSPTHFPAYTRIHTYSYTHTHSHTRKHTPIHTHAYTHTYTHMLHAHKYTNVKVLSHSDAHFVPHLVPSPSTKSCCHKISSFHQNEAHLPNLYWPIWFLVMRVTQATFACFHLITLSVDTPTDTHSHKHSYMFTPTCAY